MIYKVHTKVKDGAYDYHYEYISSDQTYSSASVYGEPQFRYLDDEQCSENYIKEDFRTDLEI